MTQKLYKATIELISSENLSDEDAKDMVVKLTFDPPLTGVDVNPPAFVIAKNVFKDHLPEVIDQYIEEYEDNVELEFEQPELDLGEDEGGGSTLH